jgi:nucleotidyltransferase/DNA polymerase involved in DNA repair
MIYVELLWIDAMDEVRKLFESQKQSSGSEDIVDEDIEERELTYEEIRQRNIARNEEFLNYLFPQGMAGKEEQKTSNHLLGQDFESVDINELCNRLKNQLPARTNEVRRIFEYLEQVGSIDELDFTHTRVFNDLLLYYYMVLLVLGNEIPSMLSQHPLGKLTFASLASMRSNRTP